MIQSAYHVRRAAGLAGLVFAAGLAAACDRPARAGVDAAAASGGTKPQTSGALTVELPPGPLRIENLVGSMTVRQGSGTQVRVQATVHAEDPSLRAQVSWVESRGLLGERRLLLRYPPEIDVRWSGLGRGDRSYVRYDGRRYVVSRERGREVWAQVLVELPAGEQQGTFVNHVGTLDGQGVRGRLRFDTGAGDVRVAELEGDIVADTGSGTVEAERLRGRFSCDNGSGPCRVRSFDGDELDCDTGSGPVELNGARARRLSLDTGSGSVRALDVDAEEVEADTGSGDVSLELQGARLRRVEVDTGSGNVDLALPEELGFEARADLASGRLTSGFADAQALYADREVVGYRRGDGRVHVNVDTGSGDVALVPARR